MEMIQITNTETSVSRLGMGGAATGAHGWGEVNDQESICAIRRSYEQGVTFYDTADVYGLGHAERVLCSALGDQLRDVTVATKFGVRWDAAGRTSRDTSPTYLRRALDESLQRLGLEQIDLYYVHWPDGVTPLEETIHELHRQKERGKIGAIGLSNHTLSDWRKASQITSIASVQLQFSLIDRSAVKPYLQETLTPTLVTWGSLAEGLLTGKYTSESTFGSNDRRSRYPNFQGQRFIRNLQLVSSLREVAIKLGKSPAQTAVRWLLDTPGVGCVLFGAKTVRQVDENLGAEGWRLPSQFYEQLRQRAEQIALSESSIAA